MNPVLQPGDELNVPNVKDDEERIIETAYNYYEVLPKEGFYRLKVKTGLTQEELEELNPELKESGLKAGMVLKIPATIDTEANLSGVETVELTSKLKNFETKKLALMLPYRLNRIDIDSIYLSDSVYVMEKNMSEHKNFDVRMLGNIRFHIRKDIRITIEEMLRKET